MISEFSQLVICEAFADDEVKHSEGQKASSFTSFIPLILITAVFYFLVIRPQQKKNKEHQQKLKNLTRGDEIITTGGIVGTVTNIPSDGDYITIEIAKDVKVKLNKVYVADFVTHSSNMNELKSEKEHNKKNDSEAKKSDKYDIIQ